MVITVRANAFLHHMVRNIAGALIAVGTGEPATWSGSPSCWRPATGARGGVTAPPQGLYLAHVEYPDEFGIPPRGRGRSLSRTSAAYRLAWPPRSRSDLVREDHAVPDQDRAPHALRPGRPLDQVPGLRRGALPRRARPQPARLPQVQPPHAHRRARPAQPVPGRGLGARARRRRSSPRIRSSSATTSAIATGCRRRRSRRARRMRWSSWPARCRGCRSWPVRSSSAFSAARWARWSASASCGAPSTASSSVPRWSASPRAAAHACRKGCCRCCR